MQSVMKFGVLQHGFDNETQILTQLGNDTKHIYTKLQGLLLRKHGISTLEKTIYICKTCFNSIKKIYYLNFALNLKEAIKSIKMLSIIRN
jgi:hypothetical protein